MLTDLNFIGKGQPWPPTQEIKRLEDWEANRVLFEGKHDRVFKDWQRVLRDDTQATMKIILNWPKRVSTLWADLLFGEPPTITAGNEGTIQQQTVDRIRRKNKLLRQAYEVGIDVSRYGVGIFKIWFDGSRVRIDSQQPKLWFPVVDRDNIKNTLAHVLAWDYKENAPFVLGMGTKEQRFLKVEIHQRGTVTTQVWKITDGLISDLISTVTANTGVNEFLVVPVHNLVTSDRVYGKDDYGDLYSPLEELETRFSQIARILNKHSDPSMSGPSSAIELNEVTGKYEFRMRGSYFPVEQGDAEPKYVTWDGNLDAAFKEVETLIDELYMVTETSPAAFGNLKQGLAESGSALRRLMMAPLAKVNRLRNSFDDSFKELLEVASKFEQAMNVIGAVPIEEDDINIDWQDGLPRDEQEVTNLVISQYTAGLASLEMSLRRLFGLDGVSLQQEIERIKNGTSAITQGTASVKVKLVPNTDKPDTDTLKLPVGNEPAGGTNTAIQNNAQIPQPQVSNDGNGS